MEENKESDLDCSSVSDLESHHCSDCSLCDSEE